MDVVRVVVEVSTGVDVVVLMVVVELEVEREVDVWPVVFDMGAAVDVVFVVVDGFGEQNVVIIIANTINVPISKLAKNRI